MKRHFYTTLLFFCSAFSASTLYAQDSLFTNAIGMKFVLIHPGHFVMGAFEPPYPQPDTTFTSNTTTEHGYTTAEYTLAKKLAMQDAQPGFTVTIAKPFYIGMFEVTQGQWKKIMHNNPSVFQNNNVTDADAHPVENVSWNSAQQFLKKLNAIEKTKRYRLPTEAEWEYAARAGSTSDIPWAQIRAAAQLETRTTNNVGEKKPNAWGLYDMLGNVWEWVEDFYNEKLFAGAVPPKTGRAHVLKGASFTGDVKNATYKTHAAGPGNGWDVGFRVVLDVP